MYEPYPKCLVQYKRQGKAIKWLTWIYKKFTIYVLVASQNLQRLMSIHIFVDSTQS